MQHRVRVVLHFFNPKELLRISCILRCYFQRDFQPYYRRPIRVASFSSRSTLVKKFGSFQNTEKRNTEFDQYLRRSFLSTISQSDRDYDGLLPSLIFHHHVVGFANWSSGNQSRKARWRIRILMTCVGITIMGKCQIVSETPLRSSNPILNKFNQLAKQPSMISRYLQISQSKNFFQTKGLIGKFLPRISKTTLSCF